MRKAVTNLEIVYEQVEISAEESQQRLDEMFDILFEETLKYMREKKETKKLKNEDRAKENSKQFNFN